MQVLTEHCIAVAVSPPYTSCHASPVPYYREGSVHLQGVRDLAHSQRRSAAIGCKAGHALLQAGHPVAHCAQRRIRCRRQIVPRQP